MIARRVAGNPFSTFTLMNMQYGCFCQNMHKYWGENSGLFSAFDQVLNLMAASASLLSTFERHSFVHKWLQLLREGNER